MSQSTNHIMKQYQLIASITRKMLQHAQNNEWADVITQCEKYVRAVKVLQGLDELTLADKLARRKLLTQILSDDAAIRSLAAPELERLAYLMGNMKRQQNLLEAYYTPHKVPV